MLFSDAPKALVEKVVQVVKLIRSKGVGIFFISQSPADIPDAVLAQLNNRVQHALHAYTPAEQKAVRAAVQSFRPNPAFKTEDAIGALGTGVALVSMLDEGGVPSVVEKTTICPPSSCMDGMDIAARAMLVVNDPLFGKYKDAVDERSAYEILTEQAEAAAQEQAQIEAEKQAEEEAKAEEKAALAQQKAAEKAAREEERQRKAEEKALQAQYKAEGRDKYGHTKMEQSIIRATRNTAKSMGRQATKSITRGLLGNSSKTVRNAASQFAGNIVSDLIGGFFR